MSIQKFNNPEEIKAAFKNLSDKTPEEQIEYRAQMISYIFLSEAEKEMEKLGWTKKQLAAEIGTSASYLTQLFRGDRLLNLKTIARIEKALSLEFKIGRASMEQEAKKHRHLRELAKQAQELDMGY